MRQLYVLCEIPPDSHAIPHVYELRGSCCPVCGEKMTAIFVRRRNHRVSSDLEYLMGLRSSIIKERRAIMKKVHGKEEAE